MWRSDQGCSAPPLHPSGSSASGESRSACVVQGRWPRSWDRAGCGRSPRYFSVPLHWSGPSACGKRSGLSGSSPSPGGPRRSARCALARLLSALASADCFLGLTGRRDRGLEVFNGLVVTIEESDSCCRALVSSAIDSSSRSLSFARNRDRPHRAARWRCRSDEGVVGDPIWVRLRPCAARSFSAR